MKKVSIISSIILATLLILVMLNTLVGTQAKKQANEIMATLTGSNNPKKPKNTTISITEPFLLNKKITITSKTILLPDGTTQLTLFKKIGKISNIKLTSNNTQIGELSFGKTSITKQGSSIIISTEINWSDLDNFIGGILTLNHKAKDNKIFIKDGSSLTIKQDNDIIGVNYNNTQVFPLLNDKNFKLEKTLLRSDNNKLYITITGEVN